MERNALGSQKQILAPLSPPPNAVVKQVGKKPSGHAHSLVVSCGYLKTSKEQQLRKIKTLEVDINNNPLLDKFLLDKFPQNQLLAHKPKINFKNQKINKKLGNIKGKLK
jgi:hypothetical protein